MNTDPNEPILPDDFPVHWNYLYICDGIVIRSAIEGTVKELKQDQNADEVRRCHIASRDLWDQMV
jgi:threonyl-tRNA synthetase